MTDYSFLRTFNGLINTFSILRTFKDPWKPCHRNHHHHHASPFSHSCMALTLATCWCALLPILSGGARFLVALTSAIESDYLQEVLWCRWLGHCDRYKTSRRYQPTPWLWRYISLLSLWFDLKQIATMECWKFSKICK